MPRLLRLYLNLDIFVDLLRYRRLQLITLNHSPLRILNLNFTAGNVVIVVPTAVVILFLLFHLKIIRYDYLLGYAQLIITVNGG